MVDAIGAYRDFKIAIDKYTGVSAIELDVSNIKELTVDVIFQGDGSGYFRQ